MRQGSSRPKVEEALGQIWVRLEGFSGPCYERSVLNFRVSFPEHVGVNWVDLANRCKNKFASSDVTVASGMTSPHTHRLLQ